MTRDAQLPILASMPGVPHFSFVVLCLSVASRNENGTFSTRGFQNII
uniref:Uncharacterized protein n=1 Tax=Piliocolobus tephrosceles TaxID=591936 RepID=A0A8C9J6Y2_9PRIM